MTNSSTLLTTTGEFANEIWQNILSVDHMIARMKKKSAGESKNSMHDFLRLTNTGSCTLMTFGPEADLLALAVWDYIHRRNNLRNYKVSDGRQSHNTYFCHH